MKKIIGFFFVFLVVFFFAFYWIAAGFLTKGDQPMLVLIRAEMDGSPYMGTLVLNPMDAEATPRESYYQTLAF